jgi:hypothetical protein
VFEDLLSHPQHADYNEVKLRLFAGAFLHLTVQGGNAHMAALFSGSLLAIYHRLGAEIYHSYRFGHFSYAATPPASLLITRTAGQLQRAVAVMCASQIGRSGVNIPPSMQNIARALSPKAQCGPGCGLPPPDDGYDL